MKEAQISEKQRASVLFEQLNFRPLDYSVKTTLVDTDLEHLCLEQGRVALA